MKLHLDSTKKYGIAVSGGVDSMVLMHLAYKEGLDAVIITIDHGLREESRQETLSVKKIASTYGYDTVVERIECAQFAKTNKLSVELAGRLLRYDVFSRVKEELGLDYILLAHHLDDQVETILMRILRGTGLYGLRGIVDRDFFLHPLLSYPKNEIMEYATRHNLTFFEDATNAETVYRRNVIRNNILPTIAKEWEDYRESFAKLSRVAKETEDYFDKVLVPYECREGVVWFDASIFDTHPAIFKRSVRKALYGIGVEKDFEEKNFATLLTLKGAKSGTSVMLGQGLIGRIEYSRLIIERALDLEDFEEPFDVDKTFFYAGYRYAFKKGSGIEKGVTLDLDKVPDTAVIRTRQDGDLFKRCNGKTKLLSDYLTDKKVPLDDRRRLLYLADGNIILAILGVEIGDCVKIDDGTTRIIKVDRYVD